MTKEEYGDFVLRYKGCGACFPMYHALSRFEKMWFSAIQKDVAELKKENAELKTKKIPQLERRIASIRGAHSVDAKKLNARIEQVERLKKENAELNDNFKIAKDNEYEYQSLLTKAKELLKWWVNHCGDHDLFYAEKTERFLNSEVEK